MREFENGITPNQKLPIMPLCPIRNVPVETWVQSAEHTIRLNSTQPIISVTIDPTNILPDSNRENNKWKQ